MEADRDILRMLNLIEENEALLRPKYSLPTAEIVKEPDLMLYIQTRHKVSPPKEKLIEIQALFGALETDWINGDGETSPFFAIRLR